MPSFLPLPWSPNPDDSQTQQAELVLRNRMGLPINSPLELLSRTDSLTNACLWRVDTHCVLKSVPATPHHVETARLARDLLVACQGIQGIPRLIHADSPLLEDDRVWTLMEWFQGEPWNPWLWPRSAIYDEARTLLKTIHERAGGVLGNRKGPLPCVSLRLNILKQLRRLVPALPGIDRLGSLEKKLADRLISRHSEFERIMQNMPAYGTKVLIHGDPRPANWIIREGFFVGLIDFGCCRWDHPASDFGRLASGLARPITGDEMTVGLARTNRWGAMTRWLAGVMDSEARWSMPERQRVEELLRLDELDT